MPKKITELTAEQKAAMPETVQKWIGIGLQCGDANWERGERGIRVAYDKAENLTYPECFVKVESPMVGSFAAPIAANILATISHLTKKKKKKEAAPATSDVPVRDVVLNIVEQSVDAETRSMIPERTYSGIQAAVMEVLEGRGVFAEWEGREDVLAGMLTDACPTRVWWHYCFGGQFWVGGWWGSPAFVAFLTDVCGLELEPDIAERAGAYRDICESVNYVWPNLDFVMVCDRPQQILRDNRGRLHSIVDMAIRYKDGWGFHCLDGERYYENPELWKRTVSGEMSFTEIMAIKNADLQAIAIKYNPDALISTGAKLVHKSQRRNELFLLTGHEANKLLEEPEIYFLRMPCPTGRSFIEGVEPGFAKKFPDADVCQAYNCRIPPEQYQMLVNEG